jgi:uncharacterized membrane protein YphA (DoxX/SURF4 family)
MAILAQALLAIRWTLALIFARAGITKLARVEETAEAINRYDLLPGWAGEPLARVLPIVEVSLSLALALGAFPVVVGSTAGVLLAAFASAMALNLARGRSFDCGCGHGAPRPISWRLVGRDVILTALAFGCALGPQALSVSPGLLRSAGQLPTSRLVPIPMTVMLVAIVLRVARLAGLGARHRQWLIDLVRRA